MEKSVQAKFNYKVCSSDWIGGYSSGQEEVEETEELREWGGGREWSEGTKSLIWQRQQMRKKCIEYEDI